MATTAIVQIDSQVQKLEEWKTNTAYKAGDRITFQNLTYECVESHTSQSDWIPTNTPALWKRVEPDTKPDDPPNNEVKPAVLPYASELFGVYQPLIGWRSQLSHETLAKAVSRRVKQAALHANKLIKQEVPRLTMAQPRFVDRTGTQLGRALAARVSGEEGLDMNAFLGNATPESLLAGINSGTPQADTTATTVLPGSQDIAMAAVLKYLNEKAPAAVQQMFRPGIAHLDRIVGSAGFFTDDHPAKSVYLSPIGLLHQFRQYFFQLGTFLGPPVGHVWISPGGTVELVEVNTRRQLVEQITEQSVETIQKTELDQTDKDELSDAVKSENANDMKLGASATASGGIGPVFQASGTASFNLDTSRKQSQEQTHKKMREQSARLSSEVRQNYKTTFRTVTETTDTSSRRYVLQNKTDRLVSYELSRKMRKVAVQVQDLGQRLCWQMYVDNPGNPLGTGEFVYDTAAARDPSLKPPEEQPYPDTLVKVVSDSFPYILKTGDKELEEDFGPDPDNAGWGMHENGPLESNDRIAFIRDYKLPTTPAGYVLERIKLLDFHGAAVQWIDDLKLDKTREQFTIQLTSANFGNKEPIPFDAHVEYLPDAVTKSRIDKKNRDSQAVYQDQLQAEKEKSFYETLRARLKVMGKVRTRSQEDMRAEERNVIYRSIITRLYGTEQGWKSDDYYAASEMIRYFFDIDAMLYFVAPDWWKPQTNQLASVDEAGHMTSAAMTLQPLSTRAALIGKAAVPSSGQRPYYLITEETEPARQGSSLGWLMQLDGDNLRNAFLNSPWVKAILPIRPGRERDAITFLQRQEVAGSDGLDQPYPYDSDEDPPEYKDQSIKTVLLIIADKIAMEYAESLKPKEVPGTVDGVRKQMALPTEMVFEHGFDPLEGGIKFDNKAFEVFSQWTEVLPTDQVVATEYALKGL
ncbi:carbohydrate-binding module family 12 protein [Cenococcum geophilum 1.58]|uniref:carbohydrate-binding module family 12 protein n=1 Tax=Cenococcum geophilum 1.58 TaxID=794803 RepID=UPI00358FF6D0|nr:carbohydrate-binding module family 12 protein [Cenococcum geophilum 1.58]